MIPVREGEILRYLGYLGKSRPDDETLGRIGACAQALSERAVPRSVRRRFPLTFFEGETRIGGAAFPGRSLAGALRGCREAVLFAATLGLEVDRLIARAQVRDMRDAVILQAVAASMIECFCDRIDEDIRREISKEGLFARRRYSPGYGDLPVTSQRALCGLLDASRRIGLTLTQSCMMVPSKSVTAIVGLAAVEDVPHASRCASCGSTDCAYREADV